MAHAPVLFISHGSPAFAIEPGLLGPRLQTLGQQAADLLTQAGFATSVEARRGLDHGAWVSLTPPSPKSHPMSKRFLPGCAARCRPPHIAAPCTG